MLFTSVEDNEDLSLKPMVKPVEVIERLLSILLPASDLLATTERNTLNMTNKEHALTVIILVEGEIDIFRTSDSVLLCRGQAPLILGLQGSPFRYEMYHFNRLNNSVIRHLTLSNAIDLIAKHHAFQDFLDYQMFLNDCQVHRNSLHISKTAYETICVLLRELISIDFNKRLNISVANFILARSNLARSGVMKILADLRKGEYVEIRRGKLINICKKFPDEY